MIHYGKQCCQERLTRLRNPSAGPVFSLESPDWNQPNLKPCQVPMRPSPKRSSPFDSKWESAGHAIFGAVTQGKYIIQFSQQPPTLDEIFAEWE